MALYTVPLRAATTRDDDSVHRQNITEDSDSTLFTLK